MATTPAIEQPRLEASATAEAQVWLGVDTHQQIHHAAVIGADQRMIADRVFPATGAGYQQLSTWARSHGRVAAAGVEQTGTYGAGLTRHLVQAEVTVLEVNHPDTSVRAKEGKSDQIDAVMAARAAASGRATAIPKDRNGIGEAIRNLHVVRALAIKHRCAARNQLRDLITTAPDDLRDQLLPLRGAARVSACANLTPQGDTLHHAVIMSLAAAATVIQTLDQQIAALSTQRDKLVRSAAPTLLSRRQVGPHVAAQLLISAGQHPDRLHSEAAFARLCGVAPIPASSGKTTDRHRLHRGGDRQANSALWTSSPSAG